MAEINLVPGTQYIAAARQRRRTLFLLSLIIILALPIALGVLLVIKQNASQELQKATADLSSVKTEIARMGADGDRVNLFERRLTAVGTLLDHHITWNPIFTDLEKLLPPATIITSFRADNSTKYIEITGTTPDIDTIAQTFASLTTSPNHATKFSSGQINSVIAKPIVDSTGATIGKTYTFQGKLFLNDL